MPSYLDKVQKQVTTAMAASSSAPEAACHLSILRQLKQHIKVVTHREAHVLCSI